MITHIKKRDPNERHLRAGFLFMEMMKRMHAYVVALLFVAAGTAFVQFQDPASVRPPVQDGRSLVT